MARGCMHHVCELLTASRSGLSLHSGRMSQDTRAPLGNRSCIGPVNRDQREKYIPTIHDHSESMSTF